MTRHPAAASLPRAPRRTAISRALRAIAADELGAFQSMRVAQDGLYFGEGDAYRLSIVTCAMDRIRAWELAHRIYAQKGYADPTAKRWYGLHDALPGTVTFLAEHEGEAVAVLTVVFDSPLGLPADELFGDAVDALRQQKRRPAELVSLACAEEDARRGGELVKRLFKLAWLWATGKADDLVITVNPRHVAFYQKMLLFERFGPDRPYGKVNGAPATPLRLNMHVARENYRRRYAKKTGHANLYRFFVNGEEPRLRAWMRHRQCPMNLVEFRRFFLDERPMLEGAKPACRAYIESLFSLATVEA